jgi:hypothetical protein
MGRAARTAAAVAAPEASAVRKITPGMHRDQVNDELQRRRAAAQERRAQRASAPGHPMVPAAAPTATSPAPTSSGAGPSLPTVAVPAPVGAAASTGSGFLLGVFAWAIGLAYLQHGSAGVKQFFRAKFFNETT